MIKSFSKFVTKYSALIVICSVFAAVGVANAAAKPQITLSQSTELKNGQVITVSGSGFTPGEGAIVECNDVPTTGIASPQPTIDIIEGESNTASPVSCSDPFGPALVEVGSSGTFSKSFTIKEGVTGPPTTGTDSAGNNADTDAALYPCPPTKAQQADGYSCQVSFGTSATTNSSTNISFYVSNDTGTGTGTGTGNGNGNSGGTTNNGNGNSTGATATATASQLANTGPGNIGLIASIIAVVLGTGFYLRKSLKRN